MNNVNLSNLSRRRFITAAGLGGATAVCVPRLLFAQETGIVPTMINEAARAKIEVHALRRNISVLEGSGGNIAVLTGKGGKLLGHATEIESNQRRKDSRTPLSTQPRWQGNDVATAGLIGNWIDETERRSWFLTEIGRAQ